jgi:hypothetical protein
MTAADSADSDPATQEDTMARTRERGQRWRCLIPDCPTNGAWQFELPGEKHLLPPHPNSHYMREHYRAPEPPL